MDMASCSATATKLPGQLTQTPIAVLCRIAVGRGLRPCVAQADADVASLGVAKRLQELGSAATDQVGLDR